MAYEPKTWVCGETITADGLNNIEDGIQEALGCCSGGLPAVTTDDDGDILTVIDGEWGKAEPGFKCVETAVTLVEESITATDNGGGYARGYLSVPISNYDSIIVTFDGTEYTCPKNPDDSYGAPWVGSAYDWSEYPFEIFGGTTIDTQTAGTYSVKIEVLGETVEASECFEKVLKMYSLQNIKDASNGGIIEGNINGQYCKNEASGLNAHAEGGYYTESEGGVCKKTIASGDCSHAEGIDTTASGDNSHAEGNGTTASGDDSHAEGYNSTASGISSHAEGSSTKASGSNSHAEGSSAIASGNNSHAEGYLTTASGVASHAEGGQTKAVGERSHAEGSSTNANGEASHAEGRYTTASHSAQHVFGTFNVIDPSVAAATEKGTYVEIVGNGTGTSARSNARTLDWNGNEVLQGSLTLGKGTADETTITATQLKALLALL